MKTLYVLATLWLVVSGANFTSSVAEADDGMVKRSKAPKTVVIHKKAPAVVKAVEEKQGPHVLILQRDMNAVQLHAELMARGLKSIEMDDCIRPDTVSIMDGMFTNSDTSATAYEKSNIQVTERMHAPVIWHSFVYRPEVVEAREQDRYTHAYKDYKLACESAGGVKRWNPFNCKARAANSRATLPVVGIEEQGPGCHAPEEGYPNFKKGQAIWVTEK